MRSSLAFSLACLAAMLQPTAADYSNRGACAVLVTPRAACGGGGGAALPSTLNSDGRRVRHPLTSSHTPCTPPPPNLRLHLHVLLPHLGGCHVPHQLGVRRGVHVQLPPAVGLPAVGVRHVLPGCVRTPAGSTRGGVLALNWGANNAGSSLSLELVRNSFLWFESVVTTFPSADVRRGSVSVTLPCDLGTGDTSGFWVRGRSNTGLESSSGRFDIGAPVLSPVRCSVPDGGTTYLGRTITVFWSTARSCGSVSIELRQNGGLVATLASGVDASAGRVDAVIPWVNNGYGTLWTNNFYLRVVSSSGAVAVQDGLFNLRSEGISVTAPAPGAFAYLGQPLSITWSAGSMGGAGATLNVELWRAGFFSIFDSKVADIARGVPTSSLSLSWTVPLNLPTTGGYFLKVVPSQGGAYAVTVRSITVMSGIIQVTAPGSSAVVEMGMPVTVRWGSAYVSGTVEVALMHARSGFGCLLGCEDEVVAVVEPNVPVGAGQVTWVVPTNLRSIDGGAPGYIVRTGFFFRVRSTSVSSVVGSTARNLQLRAPTTTISVSTTITASAARGRVVSQLGCLCASRCQSEVLLWFRTACRVDSSCPSRSYLLWDRVDFCDATAGIAVAVPRPASLTAPIPFTVSASLRGAELSAWTVQLVRGLSRPQPVSEVILQPTATTESSVTGTLTVPDDVVSATSSDAFYLRVTYNDAFGGVYTSFSERLQWVGQSPVVPTPSFAPEAGARFWYLTSALGESPLDQLREWRCNLCTPLLAGTLTDVRVIQRTAIVLGLTFPMTAMVARDATTGALVVVVQGTKTPAQLLVQDGLAALVTSRMVQSGLYSGCDRCYVHTGFTLAWRRWQTASWAPCGSWVRCRGRPAPACLLRGTPWGAPSRSCWPTSWRWRSSPWRVCTPSGPPACSTARLRAATSASLCAGTPVGSSWARGGPHRTLGASCRTGMVRRRLVRTHPCACARPPSSRWRRSAPPPRTGWRPRRC